MVTHSRWYAFSFVLPLASFMAWEAGELIAISFGKKVKRPKKSNSTVRWWTRQIPIPYTRLIDQFRYEDSHGLYDTGHEARHCMAYARRVLKEFGAELDRYKGNAEGFRSAVLTPILQRQLRGLPDSYSPVIAIYMCSDLHDVTIADATEFYLSIDPLDPACIPSYRRNLIYIREMLWHLVVRTSRAEWKSREDYNWILKNHDLALESLEPGVGEDGSFPVFSAWEVDMIVAHSLQDWFAEELSEVVRTGIWSEHSNTDGMTM